MVLYRGNHLKRPQWWVAWEPGSLEVISGVFGQNCPLPRNAFHLSHMLSSCHSAVLRSFASTKVRGELAMADQGMTCLPTFRSAVP